MSLIKTLILSLLLCAVVRADAPSQASIDKLLIVMGTEKILATMHDQVDGIMKDAMNQAFQGQSLPPEAHQFADSFQKKMMANFKEEMSWPKMKSLYLEVYGESFTQEEIDGLIAFYESPAGRAFVEKMPAVMKKSMAAMQQRMGPIMQKMQQSMQEALQEVEAMKQRKANQ